MVPKPASFSQSSTISSHPSSTGHPTSFFENRDFNFWRNPIDSDETILHASMHSSGCSGSQSSSHFFLENLAFSFCRNPTDSNEIELHPSSKSIALHSSGCSASQSASFLFLENLTFSFCRNPADSNEIELHPSSKSIPLHSSGCSASQAPESKKLSPHSSIHCVSSQIGVWS